MSGCYSSLSLIAVLESVTFAACDRDGLRYVLIHLLVSCRARGKGFTEPCIRRDNDHIHPSAAGYFALKQRYIITCPYIICIVHMCCATVLAFMCNIEIYTGVKLAWVRVYTSMTSNVTIIAPAWLQAIA